MKYTPVVPPDSQLWTPLGLSCPVSGGVDLFVIDGIIGWRRSQLSWWDLEEGRRWYLEESGDQGQPSPAQVPFIAYQVSGLKAGLPLEGFLIHRKGSPPTGETLMRSGWIKVDEILFRLISHNLACVTALDHQVSGHALVFNKMEVSFLGNTFQGAFGIINLHWD